jgi:hypothetical protein
LSLLSTWQAHKESSGVTALKTLNNEQMLSGGEDGVIICWSFDWVRNKAIRLFVWEGFDSGVVAIELLSHRKILTLEEGLEDNVALWHITLRAMGSASPPWKA